MIVSILGGDLFMSHEKITIDPLTLQLVHVEIFHPKVSSASVRCTTKTSSAEISFSE